MPYDAAAAAEAVTMTFLHSIPAQAARALVNLKHQSVDVMHQSNERRNSIWKIILRKILGI